MSHSLSLALPSLSFPPGLRCINSISHRSLAEMAPTATPVGAAKRCYHCGIESSECRLKYYNNKKQDQARYKCPNCKKLFSPVFHGRPQGKTYHKKRGEDPMEIRGLPRQCPHCETNDNAPFKYYNNHNSSQPRFKCLSCGKQFQMHLVIDGQERCLVHSSPSQRRREPAKRKSSRDLVLPTPLAPMSTPLAVYPWLGSAASSSSSSALTSLDGDGGEDCAASQDFAHFLESTLDGEDGPAQEVDGLLDTMLEDNVGPALGEADGLLFCDDAQVGGDVTLETHTGQAIVQVQTGIDAQFNQIWNNNGYLDPLMISPRAAACCNTDTLLDAHTQLDCEWPCVGDVGGGYEGFAIAPEADFSFQEALDLSKGDDDDWIGDVDLDNIFFY